MQARAPKIAAFYNGNVSFELHIKSNSVISNLGRYEPINTSNINPEYIDLIEILNISQKSISSKFYNFLYNKIIILFTFTGR